TNALVPLTVGVPAMAPLPAPSDKPAGRLPPAMDQVMGNVPPVATTVSAYATFDVPARSVDVGIVSANAVPAVSSGPTSSIGSAKLASGPRAPIPSIEDPAGERVCMGEGPDGGWQSSTRSRL